MKSVVTLSLVMFMVLTAAVLTSGQEPDAATSESQEAREAQPAEAGSQPAEEAGPTDEEAGVEETAEQTLEGAREAVGAVAETVEQSQQAQEVKAGILNPIYQLAETFSFPAFHWLAFAAMVAGVIGFGLQLTLGKLVVLTRLGFSLSEILSDALGLVVSLIGLVLTTQAAAENSDFTESAFLVLSATLLGALAGFLLYLWGQRQELQAVEGRRRLAEKEASRSNE